MCEYSCLISILGSNDQGLSNQSHQSSWDGNGVKGQEQAGEEYSLGSNYTAKKCSLDVLVVLVVCGASQRLFQGYIKALHPTGGFPDVQYLLISNWRLFRCVERN